MRKCIKFVRQFLGGRLREESLKEEFEYLDFCCTFFQLLLLAFFFASRQLISHSQTDFFLNQHISKSFINTENHFSVSIVIQYYEIKHIRNMQINIWKQLYKKKKKLLIILLINGSLIYLRGFPQERNNSNRIVLQQLT